MNVTMKEYEMLPEGTLAELIDNVLHDSPAPYVIHQRTTGNIFRNLLELIEDTGKGIVICSPMDVYLDEDHNAVQPDLIIVLNTNKKIRVEEKGHIHGVPDMLVEILSPGNKAHDQVRKKALYEKFGVSEYWIIDPDTKLASGYRLENNRYFLLTEEIARVDSNLLRASFSF